MKNVLAWTKKRTNTVPGIQFKKSQLSNASFYYIASGKRTIHKKSEYSLDERINGLRSVFSQRLRKSPTKVGLNGRILAVSSQRGYI